MIKAGFTLEKFLLQKHLRQWLNLPWLPWGNIPHIQDRLYHGIIKGGVSLYHWPLVWLVWNQLYDNWLFCFYLQNRLIQTSKTGGQQYSDTSPFSIHWLYICSTAQGSQGKYSHSHCHINEGIFESDIVNVKPYFHWPTLLAKPSTVLVMKMPALLALATLGDITQTEKILKVHLHYATFVGDNARDSDMCLYLPWPPWVTWHW